MAPRVSLITGANGFVGAALVRALTTQGDKVRCLVRPSSDRSTIAQSGAELVEGDVTDFESLRRATQGTTTVFHLAGIRRSTRREEFMQVNAESTRLVAEAMLQSSARRLVLCGSLAASGPSALGRPRVESDSFAPEEWYGESKAEAERIAMSYATRLEVTSCRPARILGPGDHENLPFFKLAKKGVVLKLLGPERLLSMVDVSDVVAQLLLQASAPAAVGEAFFCASRETTSVEAMMRTITRFLGVKERVIPIAPMLLRTLAASADVVSNLTGRRLPLNRKLARQLLAPGWTCSIDKAEKQLGFRPHFTLNESLERSAKSYLDLGWL